MIEPAKVVKLVNTRLQQMGYRPADADGQDFRKGGANSIRFKTGTSHGEVTVTVWRGPRQIDVLRIISDRSYDETMRKIEQYANPPLLGNPA